MSEQTFKLCVFIVSREKGILMQSGLPSSLQCRSLVSGRYGEQKRDEGSLCPASGLGCVVGTCGVNHQ